MRRLALCLSFLVSLTVAHAATPPPQWLPRDSWPGGKQYDPRLERTVRFWDTGVPAAQVLASLTAQTGVTLGFFPPHDDNARLCLNLYLNPAHPPTLRDLLVQLGWTMDCAWAVEGQGEGRRYLLLHTTLGDKAFEKIQQESDAAARRRGEEESKAAVARYALAVAKLPELREALDLTRDEAIKRYREKDDALLLALLDPPRRAVAQFFASLPEADLAELGPSSGISRSWEELTPEQQTWVTEAMKPALARVTEEVQKRGRRAEDQWDPLSGEWDVQVDLLGRDGGFSMDVRGVSKQPGADGRRRLQYLEAGGVTLCPDPPSDEQQFWDDIALRRLLGEQISDESLPDMVGQYDARRQLQQQRLLIEQQLSSLCHLSPEAADRLSALQLPVAADKEYALWQLQEAVAALSGLHVISDHFAQPPRSLWEAPFALGSEGEATPSARLLLQANCVATVAREQLRGGGVGQLSMQVRWEWGDAGDFLRFRSADRDAWRAAFLPADAVATLDGWLAPHLPTDLTAAEEAAVTLDVRRVGALLARLNPLQRLYGGALVYDRPLGDREQWRVGFRTAFTEATEQHPGAPSPYVMLSELDDAQWEQARAEGLRVGVDYELKPDLGVDMWGRSPRDWLEELKGQILHIGPPQTPQRPPGARHGGGLGSAAVDEWCQVEVRPADSPPGYGGYQGQLITRLTIHPERLPYLLPAP